MVGWTPLKSLEQMGPLAVFIGYQLLEYCDAQLRKRKDVTWKEAAALRVKVFSTAFIAACVVVVLLWPTGYFGPLSSRIRGLFIKHTRTGNPLVDSVAEHQVCPDKSLRSFVRVSGQASLSSRPRPEVRGSAQGSQREGAKVTRLSLQHIPGLVWAYGLVQDVV